MVYLPPSPAREQEFKCAPMSAFQQAPGIPLSVGISWRSNFAWALSGNVVYAACQWGMVIALAKLGNSFVLGQFSLGLAIATPVLMLANLQLRAAQATDAKHHYSFGEYLGLRIVTTSIGLAVIALIACTGGYQRDTAMVILGVGLIKGIEAFSDVFYGLFQLHDHLDQVGKSMMFRGAISLITLSAGLYIMRKLVWGLMALAAAWIAVLFWFDTRRGQRFARLDGTGPASARKGGWRNVRPEFHLHRQWKLAGLTLPLGIVMTLVSLNLSMPRYFIHASLGEHQLGIFSAMAYTTVAVATFADALGHSTIPRMSRMYASGRLAWFRASLLKLVAFGACFALAGFAIARSFGAQLLAMLFGVQYAAHTGVFVWLVLAAGISCIASLLNYGITSARCFRVQVPMFLLVVASNALACARLVPSRGLTGAALAMVIASLVHLAAATSVLLFLFSSQTKTAALSEAPQIYCHDWEPPL
jgi:O-antigen/teichoic acid export membrane protein